MIDGLDTLDFTGITGETFYAPTILIPIADSDADKVSSPICRISSANRSGP
jgi:hypothetical protein